jgi:hypothetical protein
MGLSHNRPDSPEAGFWHTDLAHQQPTLLQIRRGDVATAICAPSHLPWWCKPHVRSSVRFFAAVSESFLRGFHASVIRPTFLAKKPEPFVSARTSAFASCGHAFD